MKTYRESYEAGGYWDLSDRRMLQRERERREAKAWLALLLIYIEATWTLVLLACYWRAL